MTDTFLIDCTVHCQEPQPFLVTAVVSEPSTVPAHDICSIDME